MNEVVRQVIKDFMEDELPEVFERDLSLGELQPPAKGNLVNVVVGVRRCGKTYRLYQEMHRIVDAGYPKASILYFNFEDERLKPYQPQLLDDVVSTYFSLNPEAQRSGCFMFFDEVQEVPEWGTFLRRMVDTQRATIYVSGSSSKMLSAQLASAFRGRSLSRELFPMGFSEYVRYRGALDHVPTRDEAEAGLGSHETSALRFSLGEYLVDGGFIPAQRLMRSEAVQLLQEIALRTVNLDVIERYGLKNPAVATQFVSRCIASSGRELSINRVHGAFKSAGVGVARETLSSLLAYYEQAYLVFSVREFSRSIADNARSAAKVYAADPGMFAAFSPASARDEGQRLETAVFDRMRRLDPPLRAGGLSRLLVEDGSRRLEVDFVTGDALFQEAYELVQVSTSLADPATRARELRACARAMARFGLDAATVVTMDEQEEVAVAEGTIHVIPAWRWLLD